MRYFLILLLVITLAYSLFARSMFTPEQNHCIVSLSFYLFIAFTTLVNLSQSWTFNRSYLGPFQLSAWMFLTGLIVLSIAYIEHPGYQFLNKYAVIILASSFLTATVALIRYPFIKKGIKDDENAI